MPRRAVVMVNDVSLARVNAPTLHTIGIAKGLAREGFEVDLVARGPDPRLPGVRFHGGGPYRSGDRRRVLVVNARAARVLWRRRGRARALYVREDWGSIPAMAIARLLRYRVVTEVNDMTYGPGWQYVDSLGSRAVDRTKTLLARWTWQLSTWVVPVTAALGELVVEGFGVDPRRIVVLPNGVDVDEVVPRERAGAIAAAGLDPARRYVAFVGLIVERVAWDTFLRAFALVVRERPDATLLVIGEGPQERELDALVDELGLRPSVVRTGFVDRRRVSDLTGAATVCLVAHRPRYQTRIGASSVKLTEYFAAARAVVAIEMRGLREMIEESGGGIVVPPDDPEAMARAIGELLDDPERADAMGAAARRAVEERWSWQAIGRQLATLLDRDP